MGADLQRSIISKKYITAILFEETRTDPQYWRAKVYKTMKYCMKIGDILFVRTTILQWLQRFKH